MTKGIKWVVCGLLMVTLLMTSGLACAKKPEPEYAPAIAEGILQAVNDDDYSAYSEHFTEIMKNAAPENVFQQSNQLIKGRIGRYVSKVFWKTEEKGLYNIVYYKAKFTDEPKDVTVKVVFQEIGGEIYVAGLWFDSPKLRQK